MGLLLAFPGIAHNGADFGIALFMNGLFPFLLPYVILSGWLIRLTARFDHLSRKWLYLKIYFISALGGFPTGAATISHYYTKQTISKKEASQLLALCHFPSPLFTIGFIGGQLTGQPSAMWKYLLLLHLLSLLCLFYFYFLHKNEPFLSKSQQTEAFPFLSSIKEGIPTILVVASTIIFFATIHAVCMHLFSGHTLQHVLTLLSATFLEMTTALQFSNTFISAPYSTLLMVIILSSQSLSIHTQVAYISRMANIPLRSYIVFRIVTVIIVPTLYYLLFL